MGIIKRNRGKMILSAVAGAAVMGILCIIIVYLCLKKTGLSLAEILNVKVPMQTGVIVCLARDIDEGKTLSLDDLVELPVQAPEGRFTTAGADYYKGKQLLVPMKQNSILTEDIVCKEEDVPDDERLLNLGYVRLNEKMETGDFVDIRITFKNGGDFVLLSKKKIKDISNDVDDQGNNVNDLWLQVDEEEILRLASAVVDSYCEEGCEIYAIEYVNGRQEAAAVTYPVNDTVKKLLLSDPNVAGIAKGEMPENLSEELQAQIRSELSQERE